jgi:hypothetical protein
MHRWANEAGFEVVSIDANLFVPSPPDQPVTSERESRFGAPPRASHPKFGEPEFFPGEGALPALSVRTLRLINGRLAPDAAATARIGATDSEA